MYVDFSITPVSYACLLKHVDRSTSAFPPLLNAVLELATTTWLVTCRPFDAIRILQLEDMFCPAAAHSIKTGIYRSWIKTGN